MEGYAGQVLWLNDRLGEPVEYRFTFGLKYIREDHPLFPAAHPHGYLTIVARSEETARAVAHSVIGPLWAFCYAPGAMNDERFPLGELARIDVSLAPAVAQ